MKVTLLLALVALASCTSYNKCLNKFGSMDSTMVVTVDTIEVLRPVDSIRHVLDTSKYVVRETERTRLVVHRDTIICMSKEDTVHHYRTTVEVREKPMFKEKTRRMPWWSLVLMGIAGGLLMTLLIKR